MFATAPVTLACGVGQTIKCVVDDVTHKARLAVDETAHVEMAASETTREVSGGVPHFLLHILGRVGQGLRPRTTRNGRRDIAPLQHRRARRRWAQRRTNEGTHD